MGETTSETVTTGYDSLREMTLQAGPMLDKCEQW